METDKKVVNVVAAVICDNVNAPKKIFATQRDMENLKEVGSFREER